MTFLAIQMPFITKRCGICSKQYLKDEYLTEDTPENIDIAQQAEIDGEGQASREVKKPKISLARLLFALCDRCTFCGGKFIG